MLTSTRMSRSFSIIIMVSDAMTLNAPMSPMKASTANVNHFSVSLVRYISSFFW